MAGAANYVLYKSGSLLYHEVLEKGWDTIYQSGEDTWKAIKKRHKDIQQNSGQYQIPFGVINGTKDEGLADLYEKHNRTIDKIITKDKSGIALSNMIREIIENKELRNCSGPIWVDNETGLKINIEKDPYAKAALKIAEEISKKVFHRFLQK